MYSFQNKKMEITEEVLLFQDGISEEEIYKSKRSRMQENFVVLIAEDEDINYMILDLLFRNVTKIHYSLHRAINGQQAVDFCSNQHVDLVLMDIKMPVMDGYEATRLIKAKFPDLPIVVQTAYATENDRKKAFDNGCDEFLTKPIQKEQLSEVLQQFLS